MTIEEINSLSVGDKVKNTKTGNTFEITGKREGRGDEYLLKHVDRGTEHGPVFDTWLIAEEWVKV